MNPKVLATKIYEEMAVAMQQDRDPIWTLANHLQKVRDKALNEAAKLCFDAKDDGLEQSIQDYNSGCDDCRQGILHLKGRIEF